MLEPDVDGSGYDYASPKLKTVPRPDAQFPDAARRTAARIIGDPHAWYHHRGSIYNGYLNQDESLLLYNTAAQFEGKEALEIGSASGWSAWYALRAGVHLSMCDPGFTDSTTLTGVINSIKEFQGRFVLTATGSPGGVLDLARYRSPFSFVLIDGNHDLPYPMIDASAVHYLCREDAVIMLHDCWSPGVMDALKLLKAFGWKVGVYRTSNLFGVAWRGSARPVKHVADPAMPSRKIPKEMLLS